MIRLRSYDSRSCSVSSHRDQAGEFWLAVTVSCQNESDHMPAKLTNAIIEAAIYGFEAQKRALDAQIAELRAMLSGASTEAAIITSTGRPRRKMSAAARKKMAAGQRKRW